MSMDRSGGHEAGGTRCCGLRGYDLLESVRVREARTSMSRLKEGFMALALVALAGCGYTSSSTTIQPGDRSSTVTQQPTARAFYPPPIASDCSTSLRTAEGQVGIPELRGPAKGGEVVALVFHPLPLIAMQEPRSSGE